MKIKQTSIDSNHKTTTNINKDITLGDLAESLGLDVVTLVDKENKFIAYKFKSKNVSLLFIDGVFIGTYTISEFYYTNKSNAGKIEFVSKETYNIALKYVKKAINNSFKKPIEYLEII